MVLNYCFYKIHQLLIIVNVNNKQKPFTHPLMLIVNGKNECPIFVTFPIGILYTKCKSSKY